MVYINRGRDVMSLMAKEGEQGMKKAIIKIAEDNTILHQEIKDLRNALARTIELMKNYEMAMSGMGQVMDAMRKKFEPDNEANPNQNWS